MTKKIILRYLIITYLITYLAWFGLAILIHYNIVEPKTTGFMVLYILGNLGPVIAAFLAIKKDKQEFKLLIKQLCTFKVSIVTYIFMIILPILLSFIGWFFVYYLYGKTYEFLQEPFYMMFVKLIPTIGIIGLAEIGWRGVLLPQLLKKEVPAFFATLITGFLWSLWFIPLWFIKGTEQYGTNYFLYIILVFGISFLLSRFYLKSGSILIAILFYSIMNVYYEIGLNAWTTITFNYQLIANVAILVIAIILFFNMRNKDAIVLSAYNDKRGFLGFLR